MAVSLRSVQHWSLTEMLVQGRGSDEKGALQAWNDGDRDLASSLAHKVCGEPPPSEREELECWLRMTVVHAAASRKPALAALRLPVALGRGTRMRGLLESFRAHLYFEHWHLRDAIATASSSARTGSGLNDLDRAMLIRDLGLYRYRSGDRTGARDAWEAAGRHFLRLAETRQALGCRLSVGRVWLDAGWYVRVAAVAKTEVAEARRLEVVDEEVEALLLLAQAEPARAPWALDLAAAAAARMSDGPSDARARLETRVALARAQWAVFTEQEGARALCEELLEVAKDSVETRSLGLGFLAVCHAREGAEEEAARLLAQAEDPLKRKGIADTLAYVRLCAGLSWSALKRVDWARKEAEWTAFYASEVGMLALRDRAEEIIASLDEPSELNPDRVRRLVEIATQTELEEDSTTALTAVAEAALELLEAERAFVILREGEELRVVASAQAPGEPVGEPSKAIVLRAVAREGSEILAADLDDRGELRGSDSVVALELRSVLCVPMALRTGVVGALYVDSRKASEKDLSRAAWVIRALAGQAASVVRTADRIQASDRRARRGREFAHDVNGALNVLILVAEELNELNAGQGEEAVEDLQQITQRLHTMVQRFLGGEQPTRHPIDLGVLVQQVVGPMRREARRQNRTVRIEVQPVVVEGSQEQLGRVVSNLVSNALKYSTAEIHVEVGRVEEDAVLWVRDDGPGVPDELGDRIWEPGTQASDALPGQGLGLAIVKRLVRRHAGSVSAENLERGAVFTVRLPALP